MISRYDIRMFFERSSDKVEHRIDENNNIVHKETGEILCTLDDFVDHTRKKLHCDFEVIWSCHGTLEVIYRCRECGTVIFASDDVSYCDDNLCCPVCANYQTHFKYYTGEEISADEEKQKEIALYEKITREEIEADKRWKKRNEKYDWEIFKGRIKLGLTKAICYCLECDNLFKTGLKGLRLSLRYSIKDEDTGCFMYKKHIVIPLSYEAFKIQRLARRMRNRNETLG